MLSIVIKFTQERSVVVIIRVVNYLTQYVRHASSMYVMSTFIDIQIVKKANDEGIRMQIL
jgi:hypothetical protein